MTFALAATVLPSAPAIASDQPSPQVRDMQVVRASELIKSSPGANAGEFTVTMDAGSYRDAAGTVRTFATTATWVCNIKTDSPHYSSGSGGVIAKARVSCGGPAATLPVNVYMMLRRSVTNSQSGLSLVRESQYTQNVIANLGYQTWYCPAQGNQGAPRAAYFRASSSGVLMPPIVANNIGASASSFVYVP
ncbi:MAG: hypothetical protein L6311_03630 [Cellulomonas sp.]|nr:hypothetical protein [Cellulomonas sp.]